MLLTNFGCTPNLAQNNEIILVNEGHSDYVIIVPDDYKQSYEQHIKVAADEFVSLFYRATGVNLPIKTQSEYLSGKYISIGLTTLVPSDKLDNLSLLDVDGVYYFSQNNNIYLLGGSETAVVYAVYDFFEEYFNFESFMLGVDVIDTNVKNLKINNFSNIENPDIPERHVSGTISLDPNETNMMLYRYRMRKGIRGYDVCSGLYHEDINGKPLETYEIQMGHNTVDYIPYEKHGDLHGKYWYATDNDGNLLLSNNGKIGEVCFTAHGNIEEYKTMINEYANGIKRMAIQRVKIAEYKKEGYFPWKKDEWSTVLINIEDYAIVCDCDSCRTTKAKYGGTNVSVVIKMIKDVKAIVDEWFNTDEGKPYFIDNFRIMFSVYARCIEAPVKYDEIQQKYVPYHSDIALDEGLGVELSLSWSSKYVPMLDINHPLNAEGKENIIKWADISNYFNLWTYQGNHLQYLHFTDTFGFFSNETYKFFKSVNTRSWFNQDVYNSVSNPGWANLKLYMDSKLMWDNDANIEECISRYMQAVFPKTHEQIEDLFYCQRDLYQDAYKKLIDSGEDFYDYRVIISKYYDKEKLEKLINDYYAELDKVDSLSEEYYRIQTELITPIYTLLTSEPYRAPRDVYDYYTDNTYPLMTDKLLWYKDQLMFHVEEHEQRYGTLYKQESKNYRELDSGFWASLGYRFGIGHGDPLSFIIPRIDAASKGNTPARAGENEITISVGEHELDWVFGYHFVPYTYYNFTDISFAVVSGKDVVNIIENDYVLENNGIKSSLLYGKKICDKDGNPYKYFNPISNKEETVDRFDYGTLKCLKNGSAIVELTYKFDGVFYTHSFKINVI